MKKRWFLLLPLLIFGCEQYPSNPPIPSQDKPTVIIEHTHTDYVEIENYIDGLSTNKVNILSFKITIGDFNAKAIEFYGRAKLEGPPDMGDHDLHFRTDLVMSKLANPDYVFETLDNIQPETTYYIMRPKFPTNEYSPFSDQQGMLLSLTLTEAWAIDANGDKFLVKLVSGS